jgi:hypothetical protein
MSWWFRAVPLLVIGLLLPLALSPVEAEAAWNPAGEVGQATYEIIPSQGKVHVTLTYNLTNLDEETRSPPAYYYSWSTYLPTEATNVRIDDSYWPLRITTTTPGESWTRYRYEFNVELSYGISYSYTIEFDIPISKNTVSFIARGYTNTATVKILFPRAYYDEVTLSKEGYSASTTGTHTVYTYDVPQDGDWFNTKVTALRTTVYQSISGTAELKEKAPRITVSFWEGEGGKAEHIISLYRAALPLMENLWDIPFPPSYPIIVREGTYQDTKGFEGTNGGSRGITIVASHMEVDTTLIHELAHYWARRPPMAERWLWEGYAELYTYLTLRALGDYQTAQDQVNGRAVDYQSSKAECDFPLSEWAEGIPVDSCAITLGYSKSSVFLLDLYERFGLSNFKDVNGMMFSWEPDVDWFDYLYILETATGQELGRAFVGWVVPQSFGIAFQQWQSAERAYWAAWGKVAESKGALGVQKVEDQLKSAKTSIKGGDFAGGFARVNGTLQLYDQWQGAYRAYQEAEVAIESTTDTLGVTSVRESLLQTESSLRRGDYAAASSNAQRTVFLFKAWQAALGAFRDAEATIGQPSDTLGFQTVQDELDEAKLLLTGGEFSQVATRTDAALSLFKGWQQAVKAFRDAEATIGQPSDTLGFQNVQEGLDEAKSLLTGGEFSQVGAQAESTLSLFKGWQQAVKAFRDAEATIGQPSDTLGFQTVQDGLDKAQSLLTGGEFTETVDQVNFTLSMFNQWQEAISALREAEASVAQAKTEGRTWNLSSAETTLVEARNLLLASELERSLVQSQAAKEMAVRAVTPLRAVAPYVGLALAVLGALLGGIMFLKRARRRPVAC